MVFFGLASLPLFHPNIMMVIMAKQFYFCFIRPEDISPKCTIFLVKQEGTGTELLMTGDKVCERGKKFSFELVFSSQKGRLLVIRFDFFTTW
uniref:Uncharacterized protein n=1 Tax=Oncorhynchus mykiss TaxID=8022 RepID=A0A8K9WMF0_ONCMY